MNRNEHMFTGGVVATAFYLHLKALRCTRPKWTETAIVACAGAAIGRLPDIMEPATSGTHRGFFHSLSFLMIGGCCVSRLLEHLGNENSRDIAIALSASVASHHALDAMTPRGLPMITSGF